MASDILTVQLRLLIDGCSVSLWRVRLLGAVARLLRVPVRVEGEGS